MHGQENIFEKLFDDTGEMLLARACLLQARSSCQEAPARHLGKTEQDIKGTTVSMCARIGEGRRMLVPQFLPARRRSFVSRSSQRQNAAVPIAGKAADPMTRR